MVKTVSAYEARTNLGELINLAYYQGVEIIIEKMGKPMVKLTKVDKKEEKIEDYEKKIRRFTGIWANKDGKIIEKYARKFRKEFKLLPR